MASNRTGGFGRFDIYQFELIDDQSALALLGGNKPIVNRQLAENNDHTFTFFKVEDTEEIFSSKKVERTSISGKVLDETGKPVAKVTVPLIDGNGHVVKETTTDEDRKFRYESVTADHAVILNEGIQKNKEQEAGIIIKDITYKNNNATTLNTENIYFDFDSYELRNEARLALDDLVDFYFYFPGIQIEIDAHTDNIGSPYYNQYLSKMRGQKVYDYLINKGIKASALVINAKGKSLPFASNGNDLGRQLNRRVEFIIKGLSSNMKYPTATYIIKPNTNLYRLSLAFEMNIN